MKLSVVIINYNTAEMTEKAIRNFLEKENGLLGEIILIDNGSAEKLDEEKFRELGINPRTKIGVGVKLIMNKENLGFAKAANQGIKKAGGEYILLFNSDVLIEKKAIGKMIDYMDINNKIAIMGPNMVYQNGKTQASFGNFPTLAREIMRFSMLAKILPGGTLIFKNIFTEKMFEEVGEVDWLTGGCMLLRKKALEDFGILDENYFFGVEDFDICYRAKKDGWQVVYFPLSRVVHYHGFSSGGKRSTFGLKMGERGMDYFFRKHFPRKIITRYIIKLMSKFKVMILEFIFKFKK